MTTLLPLVFACTGSVDDVPVPPDYESTTGPEHCGHITADEVWAADLNPHLVTCHVDIDAGTVTIGRGTEVIVSPAKYISVNTAGAGLEALGTAEDPVRIHDADGTRGAWNGLSFWDGGSGTLTHVSLEDAGYVAYPTVPYVSLKVDGTEITVEALTITNGLDYGFSLTTGGRFSAESADLVVTGNPLPGYGEADVVGSVVMDGLDLTGNDEDVLVIAGGVISGEAEWNDPGIPYSMSANASARVDGTEEAPAFLRIGPGVELQFDAGHGLSTGGYGPGAIAIEGTVEDPVVITSVDETSPVYWEGLRFGPDAIDADCIVANASIGFGGDGYYNYGDIHMHDASPTLVDVLLHDSAAWGLYCQGACDPVLDGVTYADNTSGDLN